MELAPLPNAASEHVNEQERQVLELGGPGIIVLVLPMRILYMNQRASDLIAHFPWENHANGHPRGAKGVLPTPVLEVCSEVERLLGERSEEHTSELQSQSNLVCRLLLEKKKPRAGGVGRGAGPGSVRHLGSASALHSSA